MEIGAGVLKSIGDKGLLADGNERLGPDDEEGAAPGKGSYALLNASESVARDPWRVLFRHLGAPMISARRCVEERMAATDCGSMV